MMNCFEAISFVDERELFFLQDKHIKLYNKDGCVTIDKLN